MLPITFPHSGHFIPVPFYSTPVGTKPNFGHFGFGGQDPLFRTCPKAQKG